MAQKVVDKATFQQRKLMKEWLHLKLLDTLKVCDLGEEAAQITDGRQFFVKPHKWTVGFVSTFRTTWFK